MEIWTSLELGYVVGHLIIGRVFVDLKVNPFRVPTPIVVLDAQLVILLVNRSLNYTEKSLDAVVVEMNAALLGLHSWDGM